MSRSVAVLIAPFRYRTARDVVSLNEAKRHLLSLGWCPIFLPDALEDILDDHTPEERAVALDCSSGFLQAMCWCPSTRFFLVQSERGVTPGMKHDVDLLTFAGKKVHYIQWDHTDAPA